ncbi:MAG: hypothetical protein DMF78_26140 [Acidobacteria bacterium]|nr:MAG: hypothetical protein DMF78_26140 [Acidobacteriota bacterium]
MPGRTRGRLRGVLGIPRADLPFPHRAAAQQPPGGEVHLHRALGGARPLHEDGVLRRHLRGGAVHPLPGLGLHRAGSLCAREEVRGALQFLPKVDEYFEFYSWFLLGLGLVFQLPVIILVLARIGLVTPIFLLRQTKFAILGAFIIAAFITPTPDVVNQTLLALPMIGLYLLGVLVAWLFGRPRKPPGPGATA